MTNEISQTDQILNYLQAGNVLTPLEALRKFNCLRLGARIYDLRQHGSISDLAKGVGAHIPDVSRWAKGKRLCPTWRCLSIEKYTKGLVTRKDLRPHDFAKYWPELQYTEDPK